MVVNQHLIYGSVHCFTTTALFVRCSMRDLLCPLEGRHDCIRNLQRQRALLFFSSLLVYCIAYAQYSTYFAFVFSRLTSKDCADVCLG
jgi:hypothetical protein